LSDDQGLLIGYARVSTQDQSIDMQVAALVKSGVDPDNIYSETISGVHKRRWQLDLAIKRCRAGDTFVVWKLDRVGRSLLDLLGKLKRIEDKGVAFKSITEGIDTATPGGRLIMHVMGALAEFERGLVQERSREGMRRYIEKGGKVGRELVMTPEKRKEVQAMFKAGATTREAAKAMKVKPQTIYKYFPGGPEKYRK